MRILRLAPFAAVVAVASSFACGGSESSSTTPTLDAGALPDRSTPTDPPDAGSPVADSGNGGLDAGDSSTPVCPIAADATVAATIEISVDDNFKLYVNGVLAKEFTGTWNNVQTVDVTLNRNPAKKNVIAVEGVNTAKISGLDRMIIAELAYTVDSVEHKVVTDATWTNGTTLAAGWEALDFAEAGWTAAVVEGNHGDSPYGAILGTSDAKLLWSYDSAQVDVATKPDTETVYFRKTLYISQAGAPLAAPGACN